VKLQFRVICFASYICKYW